MRFDKNVDAVIGEKKNFSDFGSFYISIEMFYSPNGKEIIPQLNLVCATCDDVMYVGHNDFRCNSCGNSIGVDVAKNSLIILKKHIEDLLRCDFKNYDSPRTFNADTTDWG